MNRTYMVDILALFLGYQVTVDMMQQFLHVICLNFIGLQIKRGKQFMLYDYAMIRDQVLYEKMIKHSLSDCIYYMCIQFNSPVVHNFGTVRPYQMSIIYAECFIHIPRC